ncbi:hypothetical protein ACM26V_16960 [Salipaludibacillus sp. HK11]|uniref:hypothetical protein n=1 Tax=Salipaludibacillus sp. HK11 TaxID=3394320 RepID=UPI0039FD7609
MKVIKEVQTEDCILVFVEQPHKPKDEQEAREFKEKFYYNLAKLLLNEELLRQKRKKELLN